jgi:hypothetical protein
MPDEQLYDVIIGRIFNDHYREGVTEFEFNRGELAEAAKALGLDDPKNLGNLIYSFRYRKPLPARIGATATGELKWIIEPAGRAKYRFRLSRVSRILPREDLIVVKIPDSTPEIIAAYAQGDEQALLARVRYNRLIDVFLGITTYSLQNHLRTTVKGMGQIGIDELYVGVSRNGQQFVIPVQAKGGNDQLAVIQTQQDIACCEEKFAGLKCRPVSAQFMADGVIAIFELAMQNGQIRVVDEKHYKLVPADRITTEELQSYGER